MKGNETIHRLQEVEELDKSVFGSFPREESSQDVAEQSDGSLDNTSLQLKVGEVLGKLTAASVSVEASLQVVVEQSVLTSMQFATQLLQRSTEYQHLRAVVEDDAQQLKELKRAELAKQVAAMEKMQQLKTRDSKSTFLRTSK